MTTTLRHSLTVFILIAACLVPAFAETIPCAECGMKVDLNSKFAARIVQGQTTHYFCDIGDLFAYMKRKKSSDAGIEVKDYLANEWIDGRKAFYVLDEKKFKTPMGWHVAAFRDKDRAAEAGNAMDLDSAMKALK